MRVRSSGVKVIGLASLDNHGVGGSSSQEARHPEIPTVLSWLFFFFFYGVLMMWRCSSMGYVERSVSAYS